MKEFRDRKYILFDLDGTLTESAPGIMSSVKYALKTVGVDEENPDNLRKFIGPPLVDSFRDFYGFDDEKAKKATSAYREYYPIHGIFDNALYDGIDDLLDSLKKAGKVLALATSKPRPYAEKIVEHFGIAAYLDVLAASELDGSRNSKAEVIEYALECLNIDKETGLEDAVMVGDRKHDTLGSKKVGIDCIGVLYGYGSKEELEETGAKKIVETVTDLKNILI